MKLLIFTALLFGCTLAQSQTLNDIFKDHIKVNATAEQLKAGFEKIEKLCASNPEDKCKKAKASALYLLSNRYYDAATQVYELDKGLATPIENKAKELYDKANTFMSINDFSEGQKNALLESKMQYEEVAAR